jgi:hypothetical protein
MNMREIMPFFSERYRESNTFKVDPSLFIWRNFSLIYFEGGL